MSRYSISSILFFVILFALIIQVQYEGISGWWLIVPVVIYLALLIPGSILIGFNYYFKSYCKIKTNEKIIAISFDDGPHPEITPQLLNILDKHLAKASFFCLGKHLSKQKELGKLIDKKGHIIGNHSYTHHRWFDLFSSNKMVAEIRATNAEIEKTIGKVPTLFRPPYGVTNPLLKKALEKTNMYSIGWSLRSFDTIHDNEKVLKKLQRKTRAGDVILFHDTDKKIISLTDQYLDWLKKEGFKVVSLELLFNIKAYEDV